MECGDGRSWCGEAFILSVIAFAAAQFTVTLKANKDSKRLGLTGTYTLEVTPILVRLFEIGNTMPIVGWSYHELRSFTLSKGCVELECGRAAGTSAGKFVIVTKEAKEVLRVMQHYIERQLIGSGRGSAGGGQDKAQPDELCVPLTPKCSAESPPSLKKSRPDFKQVVENDYATNQDVQSKQSYPPHPLPSLPSPPSMTCACVYLAVVCMVLIYSNCVGQN